MSPRHSFLCWKAHSLFFTPVTLFTTEDGSSLLLRQKPRSSAALEEARWSPISENTQTGLQESGQKQAHSLKIFFFPFIFISWRLITLQYCSGFFFKEARVGGETVPAPSGLWPKEVETSGSPISLAFSNFCGGEQAHVFLFSRRGTCSSDVQCLAQDHKGKHRMKRSWAPLMDARSGWPVRDVQMVKPRLVSWAGHSRTPHQTRHLPTGGFHRYRPAAVSFHSTFV